jgi:hypothetical protein
MDPDQDPDPGHQASKKNLDSDCFVTSFGSESGSIGQRHGSADPDPDPRKNVMDPERCLQEESCRHFLYLKDAMVQW